MCSSSNSTTVALLLLVLLVVLQGAPGSAKPPGAPGSTSSPGKDGGPPPTPVPPVEAAGPIPPPAGEAPAPPTPPPPQPEAPLRRPPIFLPRCSCNACLDFLACRAHCRNLKSNGCEKACYRKLGSCDVKSCNLCTYSKAECDASCPKVCDNVACDGLDLPCKSAKCRDTSTSVCTRMCGYLH